MFSICKQVIPINDELYLVKRTIKESEKLDIDILKQYFDCDTVFKKDGLFYFTNKIETLEYE
jgi:hypothetical protein